MLRFLPRLSYSQAVAPLRRSCVIPHPASFVTIRSRLSLSLLTSNTCGSAHQYHTSRVLQNRKSGSGAFDIGHRELSKKQKRRRTRTIELRSLKRDPAKEKIKAAYMKKQLNSPDMMAFFESTKLSLSESIKALLLPDGVAGSANARDLSAALAGGGDTRRLGTTNSREKLQDRNIDPTDVMLQLQRWTSHVNDSGGDSIPAQTSPPLAAESQLSVSTPSSPPSPPTVDLTATPVTTLEANRALALFCERGQVDDAQEMLALMDRAQIAPHCVTFTHSMSTLSKKGKHASAEKIFNDMIKLGVVPDTWAWTALVHAQARAGKLDEARQTIERVKKAGIVVTPMYNVLLKGYVDARKRDEAQALWQQMHLEPDLSLSLESFSIMLALCAQTREVERAFFYMDEMKGLGIKPDTTAFTALFRACAGAPHWVNGYQDTIFEAMAMMEGAELVPTTEIYNAIIYAFGKAGDCAAAEYYFWEMRRKGIAQDRVTYNALLDAYAKSQSVGARDYGTKGRYVRPADRPKTEEERMFLELGNAKVTKLMSQGLWQDTLLERGKRQVGPLLDLMDEEEDGEADLVAQVAHEVRKKRQLASSFASGRDSGRDEPLALTMARNANALGSGGEYNERDDSAYNEDDDSEGEMQTFASREEEEAAMKELMDSLPDADKLTVKDLMEMMQSGSDGDETAGRAANDSKAADASELQLPVNTGDMPRRVGRQKRSSRGRSRLAAGQQDMQNIISFLDAAQAQEESKLKELAGGEAALKALQALDDVPEAELEGDGVGSKSSLITDETHDFEREEGDVEQDVQRPDNWISYCAAMPANSFSDPFAHLRPSAGSTPPPLPETALEVMALLDGAEEESETKKKDRARALRSVPVTKTEPVDTTSPSSALSLLNTEQEDGSSSLLSALLSEDDAAWAQVEFGRAPPPDYTVHLPVRQAHHIRRAELAYEDLRRQGLEADTTTLTSFMSVYAEALQDQRALRVMDTFAGHGVRPDTHSYRALVRMYIRKKDITTAAQVVAEMHAADIVGDGETYGVMIQSYAHREALPEALKMLEAAVDKGVRVPERHLRILRARCRKLGVRHPDMPADPQEWVRAAKEGQAKVSAGSQRRTQNIRSWN